MKLRSALLIAFSLLIFSSSFAQQLNWERVNPPEGGEVNTIVSDNRGYLYAGAFGGAFFSKDNGEHWEKIKGIDFSINSILSHPSGSMVFSGSYSTYYVDKDQNATRNYIGLSSLSMDSKGIIYGLYSSGIVSSLDGGKTWKYKGIVGNYVYSMSLFNESTFFAVAKSGILYSTDTCKTWRACSFTYPPNVWISNSFLRKDLKGNLYLILFHDMYKSTDLGVTWNKLKFPQSQSGIYDFYSFYVNLANEIYIGTSDGVLLSKDEGNSWSNIYKTWERVTNLCEISAADILFSTGSKGILKYNKVTKLTEPKNAGLYATRLNTLTMFGDYLIGSIYEGSFYSKGDSFDWLPISISNVNSSNFFVSNNRAIVYRDRKIFFTSNPFQNWSQLELPKDYFGVGKVAMLNNKIAVVMIENYSFNGTTSSFMLRTTDSGWSWETVLSFSDYVDVKMFSSIDNELFLGVNKTLYNSKDFGKTWTKLNEFSSQINSIAQSPLGEMYVGTWDGLYVKRISNWENIPVPYNSPYVTSIQFLNSGELFLNGHGDLYVSRDFGKHFNLLYQNYSAPIQRMAITESGMIVISTYEKGLLKSQYNTSQVNFESNNLLYNSFPNPFNNQTIIKFSLQKAARASVKIFNSIGQEIEEIAYKEFGIGFNRVIWQPKNLPSGVYFYRIQTPTFSETKKMVYLK